jgi:hypothetical protein
MCGPVGLPPWWPSGSDGQPGGAGRHGGTSPTEFTPNDMTQRGDSHFINVQRWELRLKKVDVTGDIDAEGRVWWREEAGIVDQLVGQS